MAISVGENETLEAQAPEGAVFTRVLFASYGTPTNFTISDCNAENSISLVSAAFIGLNHGSIQASNDVFGDPCGGTYKRLTVVLGFSTEQSTAPAPTESPSAIPTPSPSDVPLPSDTQTVQASPTPTSTPTVEASPAPTPTKTTPAPISSPTPLTLSAPTNLNVMVDGSTVSAIWDQAGITTVERWAVFWSTSNFTTNGWAIASTTTSATIPFNVLTSTAGFDTPIQIVIRADNDTLHVYSAWSSPVTITILSPLPSPLPSPKPSPTPILVETSTATVSPTPEPTPSPSPTPTPSPTPSENPSPSPQPTPSVRPTVEQTPQPLPTPPVVAPSNPIVPEPAPRPLPQEPQPAPLPAPAPVPSPEPLPSDAPTPPADPQPIPAPAPTDAPLPTPNPEPKPEPVPQPTPDKPVEPAPQPSPAPKPDVPVSPAPQPSPAPIPAPPPVQTPEPQKPTEPTPPPPAVPNLIPNNPDSLPTDKPKPAPAEVLVPHVQEDKKGVENGGIEFFGTKSQPQVVSEDGKLTPPAPPPGSGLPIPPEAITTADTFIGQVGGTTFNAPDVAVPVVEVPVTGALAAVPGVQALNHAFVAMANIGNDMSPVTRKKAKKILVATIIGGALIRRRIG